MAACHVRSISLPSTRSNPVIESIEEQINTLKASESVFNKLGGLKNLYESVDDLLQQNHSSNFAEEALNGSLMMLDMCSTTRDVLSQMKECVLELESCLRRRRSCESGLTIEVDKYTSSRKHLNKVILRSLKNTKRKEIKTDANKTNTLSILRDVEDISFQVFHFILSSLSQPKQKSLGWSVVSKLTQSIRVSSEASDMEKINAELLALKIEQRSQYGPSTKHPERIKRIRIEPSRNGRGNRMRVQATSKSLGFAPQHPCLIVGSSFQIHIYHNFVS